MKVKIIGIEKLDYPSRKTGRQVKGTNLHCTMDTNRNDVVGLLVSKQYCKETLDCSAFAIGDEVELFFNQWGSVEFIRPA